MLRLTDIRKSYNGAVAVAGLTLEAQRGEVLGLLGPNGAGKTTTFRIASGLISPDSGRVEIDGLGSPGRPDVRRRLGVVPQDTALYEQLSAEKNLRFFGRIQGLRGHRLAERVDWTLELVKLTDRRREAVRTWSGGMKRRLNLAIALLHDPPLLLMDEPAVGIDPQSRISLLSLIKSLVDEGRTVVYATHYMSEVSRICNRVAIIDHGRLLALDTCAQLVSRHGGAARLEVDLGGEHRSIETDEPVAELERLTACGKIHAFSYHEPDLEDVFLNLTGRSLRD